MAKGQARGEGRKADGSLVDEGPRRTGSTSWLQTGVGGQGRPQTHQSPFQVHKFLDKNHDQVRQDVLDLFVHSRTRVSQPGLTPAPTPWPLPTFPAEPTAPDLV